MAAITKSRNKDNHSIPRSVPMPVNTDDGLHVAGTARVWSAPAAAWAFGFWPECPQVFRIKRDIGYVGNRSAHPHRMAEHGWPGITQRG